LPIYKNTPNVLRVFTARSRRKNLVEQTLSRGGLHFSGVLIVVCVDL
jgi:hypothetical protein